MRLQFGVLYNSPTGDLQDPAGTLQASSELGFDVSFEYLVTDLFGVEPLFSSVSHTVELKDSGVPAFDVGDVDFMDLVINLNFHLLRDGVVDLYIGPTVGYVFWGDFETTLFGPSESFSTDSTFTYGLNFGVDVPANKKWAFSVGLSYLITDLTLSDNTSSDADLSVDPLQLRLGVVVRF